jgi:hypothetical protein
MIAIGQILKSFKDFDQRIYLQELPDPKVTDRTYVQVRSKSVLVNGRRVWYGKYVGVKGKYSQVDLDKATEVLKKKYTNGINELLSVYNCSLEDFQ